MRALHIPLPISYSQRFGLMLWNSMMVVIVDCSLVGATGVERLNPRPIVHPMHGISLGLRCLREDCCKNLQHVSRVSRGND